jgi:flavin reductase (DIM6/NTAB) family NADH-FMN oxidoreductase RutF
MEFDAATLDQATQSRLLHGAVTPRPIALVTTLGPDGPNAAPFSFFNVACTDPGMLMFSVSDRDDGAKDTVTNIAWCPEFVIHIVSADMSDRMNVCAVEFPRGVDEIRQAGFTAVSAAKVRAPRIKEAPAAFECRLVQMLKLGRRPYHLVIGEVLYYHFADGLANERGHVDVGRVNPIGRLAGNGGYARITDRFEMPRISYPQWLRMKRGEK